MESHWETTARAPVHLFAIPDTEHERNRIEVGSIPGLLSFLGYHDLDAEVKGLKDFPREERPPVLLSMISFRIMVALGILFPLLCILGWVKRNRLITAGGVTVAAFPIVYAVMFSSLYAALMLILFCIDFPWGCV